MNEIKVYTLGEVSDILKLSKRTLYNYIEAGTLKATKFGKYWRVTEQSLQEFINNGAEITDKNRRKENR